MARKIEDPYADYDPVTAGFLRDWNADPYTDIAHERELQNLLWADQQRRMDPNYWKDVLGYNNVNQAAWKIPVAKVNPYEQRLNALLDNPDSIANTGAYKFAFDQGLESVNRNLAARGLLNSGNRLTELTNYGQGLASQQYGDEIGRLSDLYKIGEQANVERQKANAAMRIEQEKARSGMLGGLMLKSMDLGSRYMAPKVVRMGSSTQYRFD